jgi:predicted nucleic acid-binding protein
MKILLDSDVVIEVLRAKNQPLLVKWAVLVSSEDEILFSPVTAAKIWPRVRPDEHAVISRFFRTMTCASIDYQAGHLAGELFRQYSRSHGVAISDALMAASAIQNQAALWTRSRKHYPMAELTLY